MGKLESKYSKRIGKEIVDVYDVLMPGNRGHKDKLTDLKEAYQSIARAIELESEDAS